MGEFIFYRAINKSLSPVELLFRNTCAVVTKELALELGIVQFAIDEEKNEIGILPNIAGGYKPKHGKKRSKYDCCGFIAHYKLKHSLFVLDRKENIDNFGEIYIFKFLTKIEREWGRWKREK